MLEGDAMFCIECGKKLPDDAKFCMYCGKAVNFETDEDKGNQAAAGELKEFIIKENRIIFMPDIIQNTKYRKIFHMNAYAQKRAMMDYYSERISWFNDVYEFAIPESLAYIENAVDNAIKILLEESIFDYSRDSFVRQFKIEDSYISDIKVVIDKYDEIDEYWRSLKQTRSIQRSSRSRWEGGGFGLGGALKGAMTAGILNAGTGIFQGIGDTITNSKDAAKMNGMKNDAFKNCHFREIIMDAVYKANIRIGYFLCCVLAENGIIDNVVPPVDEDELKLRIDNLKTQLARKRISDEKVIEKISDWIQSNPFAFPYYGFLYEILGDSDQNLPAICDFLGFQTEYKAYRAEYISELVKNLEHPDDSPIDSINEKLAQIAVISSKYELPNVEQKELAAIEYAIFEKKQMEDGIADQLKNNVFNEARVNDLLGKGQTEEVWEMLDGNNGYVEWKLTEYYNGLVEAFIDRRDYARIEKKLEYAYRQADLQNLYALYLVNDIKRQCYSKDNNKSKIIRVDEKLLELAEKGQISACASVGFYYYHGYGYFRQDYERAFEMLEYASEKNHPMGMAWLGSMYLYGLGMQKDKEEAYKWLKLAAYYGQAYAVKELKNL